MWNHFGLSQEQFVDLNCTEMEMLKCVRVFDPNNNQLPIGKLGLMYFIDARGDFTEGFKFDLEQRIAKAIFDNLPSDEQLEILAYLTPEEEL